MIVRDLKVTSLIGYILLVFCRFLVQMLGKYHSPPQVFVHDFAISWIVHRSSSLVTSCLNHAFESCQTRSHNRGRRPQARGPRKTIEKDKCAIFSENCATLNVINSRGYTHICVGLGDSLQARLRLDSRTRHMLSTKALINPSK